MRVRVLTLRYDPVVDAFDETVLREFAKDRRILAIRDHFFVTEGGPRLALVVRYEPPEAAQPPSAGDGERAGRAAKETWRELLTPGDLPLFNTLREWRRERGRRDGVPPYVIATNRQLALLVRARPRTLAAIADVEGFGKGKLQRYGAEMLGIFRAPPGEDRRSAGDAAQGAEEGKGGDDG